MAIGDFFGERFPGGHGEHGASPLEKDNIYTNFTQMSLVKKKTFHWLGTLEVLGRSFWNTMTYKIIDLQSSPEFPCSAGPSHTSVTDITARIRAMPEHPSQRVLHK
jgi:hypothetical protein